MQIDGVVHRPELSREEGQPELLESGKIADRQGLDTRILEHLDQLHLSGHQLFGADGTGAVDHVGRAVGGGSAVGLDPGDAAEAVEGIR